MKKILKYILLILGINVYSQQSFPVYTDYLTDNYFLLHPSVAGMSNTNKIRFTARTQWLDYSNSPNLQTLSAFINSSPETGIGMILYNDEIGHFKTTGGSFSYAYHLNMDNFRQQQISFGLSAVFQNSVLDTQDFENLDQTEYLSLNKKWFFNTDISIGYRNKQLYSFYTIKNLFPGYVSHSDSSQSEFNYREHFLSLGYFITSRKTKNSKRLNPSLLLQYKEGLNEWIMDSNLKLFIPVKNNEIWLGLSYRNSLSSIEYQKPKYLSVFMGGKIKEFVFAYTYTYQANEVTYSTTGFHQITLGYNFMFQRKEERFFDL